MAVSRQGYELWVASVALDDLVIATTTKFVVDYSLLLHANPREIARRLREYASRLENGENE